MAKTGTLSMANLWGTGVRAGHEPESNRIIRLIRDKYRHSMPKSDILQGVREHIDRTNLQIHSSQLNYFILDELLALFPDAKFLLTIREPYTWLNSLINHQLSRHCNPEWQWLREFRFRPDLYKHPSEEDILRQLGLFSLDGYFHYWNEHNATVITKIPADRLLVIRTDNINDSLTEIAIFINNPSITKNMKPVHRNLSIKHWSILEKLDNRYVLEKIMHHGEGLVRKFFQHNYPEYPS